ncbi:MAG: sulfatase-like hydrolase/transferase, partial [Phycisphaerae bacterium]
GELLEALKLRGMYDNSLIIVTSDHGEAFGEHGWVGHGQLLYEMLVHVPLVIRYPHAAVRGVEDRAISLTALGGLILDEVGIEYAGEFNSAGAAQAETHGFASVDCGSLSILTEIILDDDSTLHAAYDDRMVKTILASNGPAQVYDLTVDPRELVDLSAERPEAIGCALGALQARSRRLVRTRTADRDPTAISARLQRQLKSLGYIE